MVNKTEGMPEIIDNLRRIFQIITEYSKTAVQATGLTGPQLWTIKILTEHSPLRVSELAQHMYLRPATVVGILDRLEAKGLVTRTRSKEDRRAVDLRLTEAGQEIAAKAPEVAQALLLKGLAELSDQQFTSVEEGMKLMVQMLGAKQVTPQPLH